MTKSLDPVLVIGGSLTGFWIARALGRHGVDVYCVVNDKMVPAVFSRYCKGSYMAAGTYYDRERLRGILIKAGRAINRRIVVYPTSDLVTLTLSELKGDLPDDYHLVVGDRGSVEILVRKSRFYKELGRSGIDFPMTHFPEDAEDVRRLGAEMTYPVFIRPSITELFIRALTPIMGTSPGKGLIAHSMEELIRYYRLVKRCGLEVMLQEIIPGPPRNSYQLEGHFDENHDPAVLFARQRLRIWPITFGDTTLCVSIPMTHLARERGLICEFIKSIGYHGLMSAEYKRDIRDGALKLLEINARPWWHFWLSAKCGADILYSSYLEATGGKAEYAREYEAGVKSLVLYRDLEAAVKMMLYGDLGLREWTSSLLGKRVYALFSREDLSPFIMEWAIHAFQFLQDTSAHRRMLTDAKDMGLRTDR